MKPYLKFGLLIGVIIGVIVWLAVGGVNETKTYYKTISELHHLSNQGLEHNFRVAGDVAENSIVRNG
ncbi:MAG TPA: cytochrome c maturation protein CcmE, partial [Bryobacteraceae bacterium]|nr:cytochrome c maturation protein CcmE [Bryobacteraceae bacterium]